MRTLILVFILLSSQLAFTQKNFEGKIVYDCSIPGLDKASTEIYFGKQKIKIIETTNSGFKQSSESRIIDFQRGITCWINDTSKTYYETLLTRKPFDSITDLKPYPEKNQEIMGYNCSAYALGDFIESTPDPEMRLPSMRIYMWYADSLFYHVDERYKNAKGIEKATNGIQVGMGMEIHIGNDSSKELITSLPLSIVASSIHDSVFWVPDGYTLTSEKDFIQNISKTMEVADIEIAAVKQEDSPPPPPPPSLSKQPGRKKKIIKQL